VASAIIRVLLAHIAAQDRCIAELETRLKRSPQNSSLPPSTQHPHANVRPTKPKPKKKRGGHPKDENGLPSDPLHLLVARSVRDILGAKVLISNAPMETPVKKLLRVVFSSCRWRVINLGASRRRRHKR
jgi:hypothetical protein